MLLDCLSQNDYNLVDEFLMLSALGVIKFNRKGKRNERIVRIIYSHS